MNEVCVCFFDLLLAVVNMQFQGLFLLAIVWGLKDLN